MVDGVPRIVFSATDSMGGMSSAALDSLLCPGYSDKDGADVSVAGALGVGMKDLLLCSTRLVIASRDAVKQRRDPHDWACYSGRSTRYEPGLHLEVGLEPAVVDGALCPRASVDVQGARGKVLDVLRNSVVPAGVRVFLDGVDVTPTSAPSSVVRAAVGLREGGTDFELLLRSDGCVGSTEAVVTARGVCTP